MVTTLRDYPYRDVVTLAEQRGLTAHIKQRTVAGADMWVVTIERQGDDWSMPVTDIAIGRTVEDASAKAMNAIRQITPQIQRQIEAASPEAPDPQERIAVALERIADALEGHAATSALRSRPLRTGGGGA